MSFQNKLDDMDIDKKLQALPEEIKKLLIENGNIANTISVSKGTYNKKSTKIHTVRKVILRSLLSLLTLIIVLIGGVFGAVAVINYGPSEHARDLFVMSVMETSAVKFLATWFFTDDEIAQIQLNNSIVPTIEVTNVKMVDIKKKKENPQHEDKKIEVVDIKGSTYKGLMMIINDPSRVYVGISGAYGEDKNGLTVMNMIKRDGCIAGVNAGGFEDKDGMGSGGVPIGIVISDAKLKYGSLTSSYEIIGMDKEDKLIVGRMTAQKALDIGVRDAVSFGPILIVNGVPAKVTGTAGGLNPRTAIGQRADGAVLLLVIDGRQSNSLGATYSDLIDIFLEYGAINAANLDGGSSSQLIYNNEIISTCASLYGPREVPTAILVKGE